MQFKPGSLVRVRERDWIVLPSREDEVLLLKPLGGSDDEITGIYLPLNSVHDAIRSTDFPLPSVEDISDFETAKLLYDACRLSFRNSAGPFRSIARLSFRPRSYQMVPLIMALRQETVRLLIADDVGIGKTIEAGLIIRELLDRAEIRRFAVICLPHLCDQWQDELLNKFGIESEIIRSSTAARLDRLIRGDQSIFKYFPFQVISIDYIKSSDRKRVFLNECPELVIVDEAHTCARPTGASVSQQQRYHLLHDIASKEDQHLVMLTATPHSGKQEEFQSLIGLLRPQFEGLDLASASQEYRKTVAQHFVQRKRNEVFRWLNDETTFPRRITNENPYGLSPRYKKIFGDVFDFAHGLVSHASLERRAGRLQYWTALALLRGVTSSPFAGAEMLRKRASRNQADDLIEALSADDDTNPVFEKDAEIESDSLPTHIVEAATINQTETRKLHALADELEQLGNLQHDWKAAEAIRIAGKWIEEGFKPIIFCRYIATANYLGEILRTGLETNFPGILVEVITSELPDDLRKERIKMIGEQKGPRLLISTDCLSEGVNLQDYFNALIHYDLPWNPNRLDQREGRIDRFGQLAPEVRVSLLYGRDNPIDGVVLDVLLRKAQEIRKYTGYTVAFPEDSQSIMDAVMTAVLIKPSVALRAMSQFEFDFGDLPNVYEKKKAVGQAYENAVSKEKIIRSIFAQFSIKADEIENDLKETDEIIGDVAAVENFFVNAMKYFNAQCDKVRDGYRIFATNLPNSLKPLLFDGKNEILVSFKSPTPECYRYIGRNHPFIEQLCQMLMADSLMKNKPHKPARASVIRTKEVQKKTTVVQFRVRNVIEEQKRQNQIVAEEMLLWGYEGNPSERQFLAHDKTKGLLLHAEASENVPFEEQKYWLQEELSALRELHQAFDEVAVQRAHHLVEAHERFRKAVGGAKYRAVEPVLPMDVMGIHVLLPVAI